ncbi:MAG: PqqD family protein [Clostridia bacterium]|nr:PqqD family protein [Clostridia bacterium]
MKIKSDYVLRSVAGYYMVVPVGDNSLDFNGVINLNESGAFLWKTMEEETNVPDMVRALLSEYDVDEERARADAEAFVKKMREANLIDE